MKVQPLYDRILLKRVEAKEQKKGGIIIPDTAKEKPMEGKVIAVGAGRVEKGERIPLEVKVGDTVTLGQVVAAVEAMKAKHEVKAPCAGRVSAVHAAIGNEVSAGKPILTIEA